MNFHSESLPLILTLLHRSVRACLSEKRGFDRFKSIVTVNSFVRCQLHYGGTLSQVAGTLEGDVEQLLFDGILR